MPRPEVLRLPNGEALNMRPVFTDDEARVIRERHFGWEMADFATLARIFGTSPQQIASICRTHKPARAPRGAGYLASDLASPSPRAGSDAPSDHRFHGGRND